MNIHKLVKVLVSAGITASVVTGANIIDNNDNTLHAAEKETSNYKYQGDTGYGDGQFLLNDAFIKTLETDGTLSFNGKEIEASKADYEEVKEEQSKFTEEHDQKFTVRGDKVTKATFPIKVDELSIEDVIDTYGKEYEKREAKDKSYETYVYALGDQDDEDKKNVIAFKVKDDFVVETIIGYSKSY
jgi:hypothetical protein